MKKRVLIVDDDYNIRSLFYEILEDEYEVSSAVDGEEAVEKVKEISPHLVILDIRMPKKDGIEVLAEIKELYPNTMVIMVTANKDIKTAINAMKMGAIDYVIKPFDVEEVKIIAQNAIEKSELVEEVQQLRSEIKKEYKFSNIIGNSSKMKDIFSLIKKVMNNNSTVLIRGKSGTGKELVARAIHYNGPRAAKPFVAVNCTAIPETLLESELFGHEKGSFTGAFFKKIGKFEQANTGTIFLDEIGNLRMDMQMKILRVLQEREIERVGGTAPVKIEVRIIAATNVDLEEAMKKGEFREDLYYRIQVIPIMLPTLKERKEDIPLLTSAFIEKYCKQFGKKTIKITQKGLDKLMDCDWPGNVRELENTIERLVIMIEKDEIEPQDISLQKREGQDADSKDGAVFPPGCSLASAEKILIIQSLKENGGNITKSAGVLGITRKTLKSKMDLYGLE